MNGYNFTERVRKVLAMAREEAARLHHEYVGTEHILLGLIREGEGVATAALVNLGADLSAIQSNVEAAVAEGRSSYATGPDLPYTSRAKKVLELAMSEARELNHSYVGTEHLLLGVLAERHGPAAQVLASSGLTVEIVRAEVLRLLGATSAERERGEPQREAAGSRGIRLRSVPAESPRPVTRLPQPFGPPHLGALEARGLEAEAARAELESAWMNVQNTIELGERTGTPVRLERAPDGVLWLVLGDDLMRVRVPGPPTPTPPARAEDAE